MFVFTHKISLVLICPDCIWINRFSCLSHQCFFIWSAKNLLRWYVTCATPIYMLNPSKLIPSQRLSKLNWTRWRQPWSMLYSDQVLDRLEMKNMSVMVWCSLISPNLKDQTIRHYIYLVLVDLKVCTCTFSVQIKSGDDEATMSYGRTELSEFDAESEEDKQHLQVYNTRQCMWLHFVLVRSFIYEEKCFVIIVLTRFFVNEQDVISLLAYPRPEISPLRHLIQPSRRQAVADSLNQAILSRLHRTLSAHLGFPVVSQICITWTFKKNWMIETI